MKGVHHKDGNPNNNSPENLEVREFGTTGDMGGAVLRGELHIGDVLRAISEDRETRSAHLRRIADFLESYGRDSGGFSHEEGLKYGQDAEFLRGLIDDEREP